jgi:stage V sporulation protein SpoVS
MAYKTSPFSTFTYLGLTKTAASNNTHSVSADLNCKIRLNNKLLKRVKKLMEQHPALRNLLFVNANSSITEIDGRFTFLMNSANIEVFQEIQAGGINQYIKELIISSEESITLSALSELLSSQIDAELPELQDYLLKLVDVGFLELTLECSEIDPDWDSLYLHFSVNIKKQTLCKPTLSTYSHFA